MSADKPDPRDEELDSLRAENTALKEERSRLRDEIKDLEHKVAMVTAPAVVTPATDEDPQ